MKKILVLFFFGCLFTVSSQIKLKSKSIKEYNFSGPRLGFTIIPQKLKESAKRDHNLSLNSVISQFGWQFEKTIQAGSSDYMFVTELIPLIGGLEQNVAIPSISGIIGLRSSDGLEIGFGPNFSPAGSALVIAGGKTLDLNGLYVPLNLAILPSNEGTRITFLTGFNW